MQKSSVRSSTKFIRASRTRLVVYCGRSRVRLVISTGMGLTKLFVQRDPLIALHEQYDVSYLHSLYGDIRIFAKLLISADFIMRAWSGRRKRERERRVRRKKRKGKIERQHVNEKWFAKLHYERNVTSRNSRYPVSSCIRTVCCGKSRYFKISVSKALQGAVTRSHARCADEIWQGYLLTQTSTRMLGDERCL